MNFLLQKTSRTKPFVVHADKIKRCCGASPKSLLSSNLEGGTLSDVEQEPSIAPTLSDVLQAFQTPARMKKSIRRRDVVQEVWNSDVNCEPMRPRRENCRAPAHLRDYRT